MREEGILIIGSGNLVHNLMRIMPGAKPFVWAKEFDRFVEQKISDRDYDSLINYHEEGSAMMARPTNDHYLPLIYTIGAAEGEKPQFFNDKIIWGSVSMRCAAFGMKK